MKTIFFTEKVHNKRTKKDRIKNKSRVEIMLSMTKRRKEIKIMQKKRKKKLVYYSQINRDRANRVSFISIFLMQINKKYVKIKTVKKETF